MPNGGNWSRLCNVLAGFYRCYGHWPTRIRSFPFFFENLNGFLLTRESYSRVAEKLEMVPESELPGIIAEDNAANSYGYPDHLSNHPRPSFDLSKRPEEWLGVIADGPGHL